MTHSLTLKHLPDRQEHSGTLSGDGSAGRCHFCIHLLPYWCWGLWVPFITPAFWPISSSGSAPSPHTTAIVVECPAFMHHSWAVKYLTLHLGSGLPCPSPHVSQTQPAAPQMMGMHSPHKEGPLSVWLWWPARIVFLCLMGLKLSERQSLAGYHL